MLISTVLSPSYHLEAALNPPSFSNADLVIKAVQTQYFHSKGVTDQRISLQLLDSSSKGLAMQPRLTQYLVFP